MVTKWLNTPSSDHIHDISSPPWMLSPSRKTSLVVPSTSTNSIKVSPNVIQRWLTNSSGFLFCCSLNTLEYININIYHVFVIYVLYLHIFIQIHTFMFIFIFTYNFICCIIYYIFYIYYIIYTFELQVYIYIWTPGVFLMTFGQWVFT